MNTEEFSCFICGEKLDQNENSSYRIILSNLSQNYSDKSEKQELYSHEDCLRQITKSDIPLLPLE